jgi:hypothetical protein
VGILALTQPAEAKIVYTPAHKVIPRETKDFPLDLNNDGVVDFTFWHWSFSGSGSWFWVSPATYKGKGSNEVLGSEAHGQYQVASALRAGTKVGPNARFVFAIYNSMAGVSWYSNGSVKSKTGRWQNAQNMYLGLKFVTDGAVHYGWARLNVHITPSHFTPSIRAVLTGYAYETIPNKPIITGKTKGSDVIALEPDSLGALAAGASRRHNGK